MKGKRREIERKEKGKRREKRSTEWKEKEKEGKVKGKRGEIKGKEMGKIMKVYLESFSITGEGDINKVLHRL